MRQSLHHSRNRRGTVTVIVVAFLALFAVLGLTFLIASQRFATTTRLNRETMTRERDTPPQPDILMQRIMSDLMYESPDIAPNPAASVPGGPTGYYKATRGWSLSRLMYGRNDRNPSVNNTLPYSGIGRKRDNALPASVTGPTMLNLAANYPDYTLLNYTYFPQDGFIRDPELAGPTAGVRMVSVAGNAPDYQNAPPNPADYYWPINANYTSPDSNNPYLAVVDPTTGKVLLPSFHRPNEGIGGFGTLNPNNPNWTSKIGKYLTFRPRRAEHSPAFPLPKEKTLGSGVWGDVQNLEGPGEYDSIWLDLDLEVSYWRGKRYKPLVALLITDLDNRLNLNTAGNLRNGNNTITPPNTSPSYSHGANQNWGPWETDLSPVFLDGGDADRLLRGNQATSGRYGARYVTVDNPNTPAVDPHPGYKVPGPYSKRFTTHSGEALDNNPVGGYLPHFYSPVDMDAGVAVVTGGYPQGPNAGSDTAPYQQFKVYGPSNPAMAPFSSLLPDFVTRPPYAAGNRYWNGMSDNEVSPATLIYSERLNHPMLFNPYLNPFVALGSATPLFPVQGTAPRSFHASEMVALNARYRPINNAIHPITGGNFLNTNAGLIRSDAAKLTTLGLNTSNTYAANRFRVTTISNDLARPGATPWFYADGTDPMNNPASPFVIPTMAANYPFFSGQVARATNPAMFNGDYDSTRRQSLATMLGAVDLSRPLTDYRLNINAPYSVANLATAPGQLAQALSDRQLLASDIFLRLRAATGMPEVSTLTPSTPAMPNARFEAARLLAQLAVNIVDQIDNDDYCTPFNWNTPAMGATPDPGDGNGNIVVANASLFWVFGHELPRLVVNEAFVRLENDPTDPEVMTPPKGMNGQATKPYKMRVWAELHNPLTPRDTNEIGYLADSGKALLVNGTAPSTYSVYRMRLVKGDSAVNGNTNRTPAGNLMNPANTGGEPDPDDLIDKNLAPATLNIGVAGTVAEVSPNLLSGPTTGYGNTAAAPQTFYIAGPKGDAAAGGGMPKLPDMTATPAHGQFDTLEYDVPLTEGLPAAVKANPKWSPIIVLQRLANEHFPPSATNPYITVDTFMTADYAGANVDAINTPIPVSIIQDRVQIDANRTRDGTMPPAYDTLFSYGRRQPYDGRLDMAAPAADTNYRQQPDSVAPADKKIRHTFTRHNGIKGDGTSNGASDTLKRPFDTMPHLDRTPTSAAELLNVSQFGPHLMTQLFYANSTGGAAYKAAWLDERTGLYRAFDLLGTRGRFHGQGFAGRTPGKVNVNTLPVTDSDTLDDAVMKALTSANTLATSGKHYTAAQAGAVLTQITTARNASKTNLTNGTTRPILGTMSPLTPAGDPQYPDGMSSAMTIPGIIRDAAGTTLAGQELMETLLPNLTTRSNTFAIYGTIGFFEVLNPGTGTDGLTYADNNRPIMGAEVLGIDGKSVRYKFFSVVDRTQLSAATYGNIKLQGIGNVHFSYEPVRYGNAVPTTNAVGVGSPDPQPPAAAATSLLVTVAVPRTSFSAANGGTAVGYYDGIQWKLKQNDPLYLEYNPDAGGVPGSQAGSTFLPATPLGVRNRWEQVNVMSVTDDPSAGRALVTFAITRPHHRGCNMMMIRPDNAAFPFDALPGNPGAQQNNFTMGANTYRTVIPVFERVDGY